MKASARTRLAAHLRSNKLTPAAFAKVVRANRSQIYRLLDDERSPGIGLGGRIEAETGIPATDWPDRRSVELNLVRRSARRAARGVSHNG